MQCHMHVLHIIFMLHTYNVIWNSRADADDIFMVQTFSFDRYTREYFYSKCCQQLQFHIKIERLPWTDDCIFEFCSSTMSYILRSDSTLAYIQCHTSLLRLSFVCMCFSKCGPIISKGTCPYCVQYFECKIIIIIIINFV